MHFNFHEWCMMLYSSWLKYFEENSILVEVFFKEERTKDFKTFKDHRASIYLTMTNIFFCRRLNYPISKHGVERIQDKKILKKKQDFWMNFSFIFFRMQNKLNLFVLFIYYTEIKNLELPKMEKEKSFLWFKIFITVITLSLRICVYMRIPSQGIK